MSEDPAFPPTSPAATDTGNLLDALLSAGPGGGFSIDYERVPQAIADLEHAAEFFRRRAEIAKDLARVPPPGLDGVSVNAVVEIGKWADDSGDNNLATTLRAGALQLERLAQRLREELKTYLHVEELNIPKPSPGLPL